MQEYGSCDCSHKEASVTKIKGAFALAQDELQGWTNLETTYSALMADLNAIQT